MTLDPAFRDDVEFVSDFALADDRGALGKTLLLHLLRDVREIGRESSLNNAHFLRSRRWSSSRGRGCRSDMASIMFTIRSATFRMRLSCVTIMTRHATRRPAGEAATRHWRRCLVERGGWFVGEDQAGAVDEGAAMATRWRWRRRDCAACSGGGRPGQPGQHRVGHGVILARGTPVSSMAMRTFCRAVRLSSRLWAWKMKPMLRRISTCWRGRAGQSVPRDGCCPPARRAARRSGEQGGFAGAGGAGHDDNLAGRTSSWLSCRPVCGRRPCRSSGLPGDLDGDGR